MFNFPENFEDDVTELVTEFFKDLPADNFHEPETQTNLKLPRLADKLQALAIEAGCLVHFSTPKITDIWQEGHPSTYTIKAKWFGVSGQPEFEIPVLPRGAA